MKLFLISFLIVIIALSVLFCNNNINYQISNHVKIAHKITNDIAKQLENQKKLFLVGTGGRMMDDVKEMDMSFHYYQEVDVFKSRELIVDVINEYLAAINNNETIRPYLHKYPFTEKNIQIRIWIHVPNRNNLLNHIHYISAINGTLTYYLGYSENDTREIVCEETYKEALQKIALQKLD